MTFALQLWTGKPLAALRPADQALVVLAIGPMTVSVTVDAETCLNHVAQLALFLRSDVEIAVFGDDEKKWKFRGQRP